MPAFDTYACSNCGDAFKAVEGANAAEAGYCSPRCGIEGEGLA